MDAQEPKPPDASDAPRSFPPGETPDELDSERLEVRLEEFEHRLRARAIEISTELKAKERLRERVRELTSRVDELQDMATALHREAASATSLARELDEKLRLAAEARGQLGAALEAERARRLQVESELSTSEGVFIARAFELESEVKRLSEERAALQSSASTAEEVAALIEIELVRAKAEGRALAERAGALAAELLYVAISVTVVAAIVVAVIAFYQG